MRPPNVDRVRYMIRGILMKLRHNPWQAYNAELLRRVRETEARAWATEADLGFARMENRRLQMANEQLRTALRNQDLRGDD